MTTPKNTSGLCGATLAAAFGKFIPCLQQIWGSKRLTNSGPLYQQLEQKLCDYPGVKL